MQVLQNPVRTLPVLAGSFASAMVGVALAHALRLQPSDVRDVLPVPHLVTTSAAAAPDHEWRT